MTISVCSVSWNAHYALALMRESAIHFNPEYDFKFLILDNGSTDGAREYADRHADLVLTSINCRSHGVCLTELGRRVETEYFICSDNDIAFTNPGGVKFMFDHMNPETTWVVCPSRPGLAKDTPTTDELKIGYSPNICVGLFHTETFQKVCKELDLGYAGNFCDGSVWETGGLAWRVARTHGLDSVELPELWDYCFHFGNMSTLFHHMPNYPSREGIMPGEEIWRLDLYEERYGRIKAALAEVRGCSVEDLDAHEPPGPNRAVIEKLDWDWVKIFHPFLTPGAGVR